jgi:hypothetical protein
MIRLAVAASLLAGPVAAQVLHFSGEWRFLEAGRVQAHLGATGARMSLQTAGLADRLYSVRSAYAVTYDRALCASSSTEDSSEGKKHREIKITFADGKAVRLERDLIKSGEVVSTRDVAVPACVHDVLGALEKLRRLSGGPGAKVVIPISDGRKSAEVEILVQAKETIRTAAGVFHTVRHEAMLFNGVIFRRKARLFIWLTDDARRLPVQIRVQMPFYLGTVTLQLEKEEPG